MRKMISVVAIIAIVFSILTFGTLVSASSDGIYTRRGICITGNHPDSDSRFFRNCQAMNAAFNANLISSYYFHNTEEGIDDVDEAILDRFMYSDDDDVNYIYLSGHGSLNGNHINLGEPGCYYFDHLRNLLDTIPGHFVLFIQSCYSGDAIDEAVGDRNSILAIEEKIVEYFVDNVETNRNGELGNTAKYTVYCSSESGESSPACYQYSYATYYWALGFGYDMNTNYSSTMMDADINYDGIVTAEEMGEYSHTQFMYEHPTWSLPVYYAAYYFETICTNDFPLGDPTRNGTIDMSDVLLIRRYIANMETLAQRQIQLSDIDGNGTITNADCLLLQKYIAKVAL